jgi:hypothetical protein
MESRHLRKGRILKKTAREEYGLYSGIEKKRSETGTAVNLTILPDEVNKLAKQTSDTNYEANQHE